LIRDNECIPRGLPRGGFKSTGGLTLNEFTTLSEAQKEKIRQERPRWCHIEYKGIHGWVAGRYFPFTGTAENRSLAACQGGLGRGQNIWKVFSMIDRIVVRVSAMAIGLALWWPLPSWLGCNKAP